MSYKGKKFFITGGTGSLGQAIIKRLLPQGAKVIVYSRDEGKQALLFNGTPVKKVLGDVRDYDKLNTSLRIHKPDYILHTGALKRIDDMEFYPDESVKTNTIGSDNVARAALENNIEKCILVSTDKACKPVNVYGASKFIAERMFTNYDYTSPSTIFASVRYGNVIASRGSFIPLFLEWIKEGKSLELTSEDMTRFLFTLDDAVDAVLGALDFSMGGECFVPQIDSYTLPTVVKALEKISGVKAKTLVKGLRPGEKLHEDMLAETELPFAYQVTGKNLIQIRPQYTQRTHSDSYFKKYNGPHFNSELWVQEDVDSLVILIEKGLLC